MTDTIVVPTYDRPEYLTLCLERLAACHSAKEKNLIVCVDVRAGDNKIILQDALRVMEAYKTGGQFASVDVHWRMEHNYYGNSYNVVKGLMAAIEDGAERVYLVEDDVMVREDFLLWHDTIAKMVPFGFVAVASPIIDSLNFPINGPEVMDESLRDPFAFYVSKTAYSSVGVSFGVKALEKIKHLNTEETFKKFAPGIEQDIIIQNLLKVSDQYSVWPYVPRAWHMGWYGYHRNTGLRPNGNLDEKISALRAAFTNQEKIDSMARMQKIRALPTEPAFKWWEDPRAGRKFQLVRKFR